MSETGNIRLREEEDALIQRIAAGDSEAFACLYSRLHRAVFAYALSILKNKEDAEEVMQDCFLKIRSAAHLYKSRGKGQAWIFTIARNLSMMKLRERQKSVSVPAEDMDYKLVFEPDTDISLRLTLETAMKVLNEQDHRIIILHALSDMTFRDIARIMEMPLATVLSKYHRGLKKLRKELEGRI